MTNMLAIPWTHRFAIGLAFIGLPLLFAWVLSWQQLWFCWQTLANGIESTATVERRGSLTNRRRGRTRVYRRYSVLQYDGYRGETSFWVKEDTVPVIYPKTDAPPNRGTDHRIVLVGRKSDGFLTIFNRNFKWISAVFWVLVNAFCIPIGLLFMAPQPRPRAQHTNVKSEKDEKGVEHPPP